MTRLSRRFVIRVAAGSLTGLISTYAITAAHVVRLSSQIDDLARELLANATTTIDTETPPEDDIQETPEDDAQILSTDILTLEHPPTWVRVPNPDALAMLESKRPFADNQKTRFVLNTVILDANVIPQGLQIKMLDAILEERETIGQGIEFDREPALLEGIIPGKGLVEDVPYWGVGAERPNSEIFGLTYYSSIRFFPTRGSVDVGKPNEIAVISFATSNLPVARENEGMDLDRVINSIQLNPNDFRSP